MTTEQLSALALFAAAARMVAAAGPDEGLMARQKLVTDQIVAATQLHITEVKDLDVVLALAELLDEPLKAAVGSMIEQVRAG